MYGSNNIIKGSNATVTGNNNVITGSNGTATGNNNKIVGTNGTANGNNNKVVGANASAHGVNNEVTPFGESSGTQVYNLDGQTVIGGKHIECDNNTNSWPSAVNILENFGIARQVFHGTSDNVTINFAPGGINKAKRRKKKKSKLPDPIENEPEAEEGEKECCVCLDRSVKTCLKPCNHVVLCVTCSLQIGLGECPTCKEKIKKIERIYS